MAATFRQGEFRPFDNYLAEAKQNHIIAGHVLDDFIRMAATRADRVVSRGQGPGAQASTFDFDALAGLVPCQRPAVTDSPRWPLLLLIIGT